MWLTITKQCHFVRVSLSILLEAITKDISYNRVNFPKDTTGKLIVFKAFSKHVMFGQIA